MLLIKLDATDSTNAYLKDLLVSQNPPDGTVVQTNWQKKGRGQHGRQWLSEPGKNLTISVLKRFEQLKVADQFVLSIITSLAVADVLIKHGVPNVQVKWPNDILSGKQKLCGILVENIVKGTSLKAAVLGIGLNVNQDQFPYGLNATSIKLMTGKELPLDTVLNDLIGAMELRFDQYLFKPVESAIQAYEELLFGRHQKVELTTPEGTSLFATIQGIDARGRLRVKRMDGKVAVYGFNEIRIAI